MSTLGWNVRVNLPAIHRCSPDWRWNSPAARMRDFDLWHVFAGQGWLRTPAGEQRVGEGSCFLLRPERDVRGRHDPRHPLAVIAVHFDFLDADDRPVHPPEDALPAEHRRLREPALVTTLLTRSVEAFREAPGGRVAAAVWLRAALLEIERQDALPALDEASLGQREAIGRICAEIARQPAKPYRIAALARRMHCSPDHFARLFRRFQGATPGEYVIRCRVEAAKTMLRGSSLPVTRLAELLGYRDVYYFSKQFRQRTGLTPTQFRKE